MAYNSGFNPDALPAHIEPAQAAQLLSNQQQGPPLPQQQSYPPQQFQQQRPDQRRYSNPQRPYSSSNPPSFIGQRPHSPQYQNKPQPPLPPQQYQNQDPRRHSPSGSYDNPPNPAYGHNGPSPQQSPPIQNSGFAPPQNHGRPPPPSRPPGTPAPGSSADASLFPLFKAVDRNGAGQLTERELGKALVNGDFTSFDSHTVKMMIRMFDSDKNGSINFDEFCGLWAFLASWRALFDRFDTDHSGSISFDEYTNSLVAFGYKLSTHFVRMLYQAYDKGGQGQLSFDLYVQSCIILKRMTDVFKKYDDDRDGYITLSFEEFLTEVLLQK